MFSLHVINLSQSHLSHMIGQMYMWIMLETNVLLFYAFNLELAVVVCAVQNVAQHEESHLHTQHCTAPLD